MDSLFGLTQIPAEVISGLVSGIVASAIVAFVISRKQESKKEKAARQKFASLVGDYNGYSFEKILNEVDDNSAANYKRSITPNGGTATIQHVKDNLLTIFVRERDGFEWNGKIFMQEETVGSIVWRYTHLPISSKNEWHWFGLKRLLLREEKHYVYLYLIGEVSEGFGNEVLIRRKLVPIKKARFSETAMSPQ